MSSSCSFRITRPSKDLGNTLLSVSERLMKLEQRLGLVEHQLTSMKKQNDVKEFANFDHVNQVLKDCKDLLEAI